MRAMYRWIRGQTHERTLTYRGHNLEQTQYSHRDLAREWDLDLILELLPGH